MTDDGFPEGGAALPAGQALFLPIVRKICADHVASLSPLGEFLSRD